MSKKNLTSILLPEGLLSYQTQGFSLHIIIEILSATLWKTTCLLESFLNWCTQMDKRLVQKGRQEQ